MIARLVQSAFSTGYLSVESEGLIRQIVAMRGYRSADVPVLERLCQAVETGEIQREASGSADLLPLLASVNYPWRDGQPVPH